MAKRKKEQSPDTGLNEKQQLFAAEYPVDFNATQAAIRAGYTAKSAGQTGHELLKIPQIKSVIAKVLKERIDKTIMGVDEVLHEYSRIGRSDILNYATFGGKEVVLRDSCELVECEARAISEVAESINKDGSRSVKVKLHDKVRALDSLSKYYKLFSDSSNVNVNLSWVDLVSEVDEARAARAKAEKKAKEKANESKD